MSAPVVRESLTRESIIAAARALIIQDGLEAISLRRVGAALGVTAPALYAHVIDKRDLLRGVAELELIALMTRFDSIVGSDPVDRIRQFCRAYIDQALEHPELFKTMFGFPPRLTTVAASGDELALATRSFEMALVSVNEAIEQKIFRDIDPDMAALTLWAATHGCAHVLLLGFAFEEQQRDALVTSVIDTVIAGLRA